MSASPSDQLTSDRLPSEQFEFERLQLRPDIEWIAQPNQSKWVARDPLSGAYFYFSEIEYVAAKLLCGGGRVDSVIKQLRLQFPSDHFTLAWLRSFASRLSAAQLLSPTSPHVSQSLAKTKKHSTFQSVLKILAIPLIVRVPLFNPARLLDKFRWLATFLFHPLTCFAVVATSLITSAVVLGNVLESGVSLLPNFSAMKGDRWLLLLLCYAIVKSLHELGHSLACARFRVDCQEIGLLFLYYTPCF